MRTPKHARCEECRRKPGTRLCYKLDPVNWRPETRRLCRDCRVKLGYALVDYNRKAKDLLIV